MAIGCGHGSMLEIVIFSSVNYREIDESVGGEVSVITGIEVKT